MPPVDDIPLVEPVPVPPVVDTVVPLTDDEADAVLDEVDVVLDEVDAALDDVDAVLDDVDMLLLETVGPSPISSPGVWVLSDEQATENALKQTAPANMPRWIPTRAGQASLMAGAK